MDNYYEILNLSPNASEAEIRGVIRTLRKKYRQVTGSPNKEQARNAEVMMDKLSEAEKNLLDPSARSKYDADLRNRPPETTTEPSHNQNDDWVTIAQDYLSNGQPRNAAQAAKQGTQVEPNNVQAWVVRAYADLEINDYADADFSASEAQRRDPNNAQMFGIKGDVYDGEKRYQEAQAAFQRAADLEPTNPYWQGRVIWAIFAQGNGKKAVDDANTLLINFPQSDYARTTYAMMVLSDAESSLSNDGPNVYITNTAQIEYMDKQLAVVNSLNCKDESVLDYYKSLFELNENSKKRRYIGPGFIYWVKVLAAIFIGLPIVSAIFAGFLGFLLVVLILAGIVWYTYEHVYPTQWKINREAIGDVAAKTGLQK